MSIDWYKIEPKCIHVDENGLEYDLYERDGFLAALETPVASDVEIYNADLTRCRQIKAIVQQTVQDTALKTKGRQILAPIGSFKAGEYIKYNDKYWLIIGLVDNNKIYEKGIITLCNYLLTWKNDRGDIIQRWVNVTSASQYNNGESGNVFFNYRSDQLMVLSPDDDECLMLNSGKKFIIDRRCDIYERNMMADFVRDTSNSVSVYKITRSDTVLFDYQGSGYFQFMVTQCEQGVDDGCYSVDGKKYWLCENHTADNKASILFAKIVPEDEAVVYVGVGESIFHAEFYNSDRLISISPVWKLECDCNEELDVTYVDNSIMIATNNESLIGKSINLILKGTEEYEEDSIEIKIKAFY